MNIIKYVRLMRNAEDGVPYKIKQFIRVLLFLKAKNWKLKTQKIGSSKQLPYILYQYLLAKFVGVGAIAWRRSYELGVWSLELTVSVSCGRHFNI